ncbi:Wiskott-Aldrich syndrome protein family member 1 [Eumeta japonica]|uniref:Wiskott-Aldrich syndrome protein family member 1 n=1 Tax=Eumeta variegata TaxID=151549 RepID=A0A4C1UU46_EUMVA|nr:Wiskott-Aldrich syndrome protein family member 1 [Eumeta japonica]
MSSEGDDSLNAEVPPPPPPPPPEPEVPTEEERPRPPSPGALLRGASALKPPRAPPEPQPDPRSDLLKAIRDGIKLRKVEKRDDNTGRYDTLRGAPAFLDVASILARRVAVELSDSSSGGESDSDDSDQWSEQALKIENSNKTTENKIIDQKSIEHPPEISQTPPPRAYVKNSSFLSRDIEAQRVKSDTNMNVQALNKNKIDSNAKKELNHIPPVSTFKITKMESKPEKESIPKKIIMNNEQKVTKEIATKMEKPAVANDNNNPISKDVCTANIKNSNVPEPEQNSNTEKSEESNGVGDKIKKFEKAAEDCANAGRLSRPGSVRRARSERLGSDSKDEPLSPPPPPPPHPSVEHDRQSVAETRSALSERHHNISTVLSPNLAGIKWQKSGNEPADAEKAPRKLEPQKIIKPEFKALQSPADATIRSPSLGSKIGERFPSHDTAFRNVSPAPASAPAPTPVSTTLPAPVLTDASIPAAVPAYVAESQRPNEDVNTQNNFKSCKFKGKEKYSVSKGSSYFTRGSEEIWLVKKKDIEEIEERVLDSFRRAGGSLCVRGDTRPASDGHAHAHAHATMGRTKRHMYARSESLDPQWAGTRAHTLKRQASVACTCGHDKKARAKSATPATPGPTAASAVAAVDPPRPRSRSHGDDSNSHGHVLDKYETLV